MFSHTSSGARTGRLVRILAILFAAAIGASALAPVAVAAPKAKPPKVLGMVYTESTLDFDATWATLLTALDANPNLRTIATIDHDAAAASVGLDLEPNHVVFFGNPNIGTSLMQVNQIAGIDLPQKIHVVEVDGSVFVGFNDATYLANRHDLGELATLDTIAGALRNLTAAATNDGTNSRTGKAKKIGRTPLLETVASDADIDTTWNRLLAAIDASPANIFLTIDHQMNAAGVGLELAPTRLVVFGNPNIGTPIMHNQATTGIDLPLKILVWEDETGQVQLTTNSTDLFKTKHRVNRVDFAGINGALNNFITAATTTP